MSAGGKRRALVTGGSGYVGGAVVKLLRERGLDVVCTYHRNEEASAALRAAGATAIRADLRIESETHALGALAKETPFDVFVHAAGEYGSLTLDETDARAVDDALALAVRAPLAIARALASRWDGKRRADIVLVSALDRAQNLALPIAFAAGEGAKGALAMALAKELGPRDVRVNAVALGLLDGGMSREVEKREGRENTGGQLSQDFAQFSALGRRGTAEEVARVIAFVALDSDFLSGRTIAVNGGL